jgi:hypothetical protein
MRNLKYRSAVDAPPSFLVSAKTGYPKDFQIFLTASRIIIIWCKETSSKDHPYSRTTPLKDHICVARIAL